jgi:hypothetical protein
MSEDKNKSTWYWQVDYDRTEMNPEYYLIRDSTTNETVAEIRHDISNKDRNHKDDAELLALAPDLLAENRQLKKEIKRCHKTIGKDAEDLTKLEEENRRLREAIN